MNNIKKILKKKRVEIFVGALFTYTVIGLVTDPRTAFDLIGAAIVTAAFILFAESQGGTK